ncbi:MAG TPA: thioredoxin domain-containing protein [Anaerolineales bacterium]|nr:thioredoxin domain-containing protein [Anaerolineales bacterium]
MNQLVSPRYILKSNHPRSALRLILSLGVIAGIVVVAALIFHSQSEVRPLSAARLASDPSLGSPSARVTIIEYGDFGCVTCRGWEQAGVLKQIVAAYGDQVHFVWRDFPVITAQSPGAAEAAQCAFDQGKFWEYHDLLYAKAPALSISDLKSYASQIGLNASRFDQCLDSGQNKAKVEQSLAEARGYGFVGTPSFIVNGKRVVGPASFNQFKSMIDPILAGG